jgi:hypothetical protein
LGVTAGPSDTAPNGSRAPSSKRKAAKKSKRKAAKAEREQEQDPDDLPPLTPADIPTDPNAPVLTPQEIKRGRIFEIAQLMASGEWRASMAKVLAKRWSSPAWMMSVKTVQHYSAEASRLVDYTTGQREKLVSIARLRLLQVLQENESDRVQAARTLLEHMGELRQNIVVKAPDPFEGWTEEEVIAYGDTGQRPERFGPPAAPKK